MSGRAADYARRHAVGLLALFVALGGTSYAVGAKKFTSPDGRVTACAKKRSGEVRLVVRGKRCRTGEQRVTWARRGRVGPTGAAGAAGAPGPAGAQGAAGPDGSIQGAAAGGDLAGSYPDPRIAASENPRQIAANPEGVADPCAAPDPQPMVLCGTSANHWAHGGFGIPGVEVFKDRLGQVHVRGSATLSTIPNNSHPALFVLPPELRPKRLYGFTVATGASGGAHTPNAALLVVYPDGYLGLFTSSNDRVVHLGELTFRTDA